MFLPKWCSGSEMFMSMRATFFEALIRKSQLSLILYTENSRNHYVKYVPCPELLCQSKLYNIYFKSTFTHI